MVLRKHEEGIAWEEKRPCLSWGFLADMQYAAKGVDHPGWMLVSFDLMSILNRGSALQRFAGGDHLRGALGLCVGAAGDVFP